MAHLLSSRTRTATIVVEDEGVDFNFFNEEVAAVVVSAAEEVVDVVDIYFLQSPVPLC